VVASAPAGLAGDDDTHEMQQHPQEERRRRLFFFVLLLSGLLAITLFFVGVAMLLLLLLLPLSRSDAAWKHTDATVQSAERRSCMLAGSPLISALLIAAKLSRLGDDDDDDDGDDADRSSDDVDVVENDFIVDFFFGQSYDRRNTERGGRVCEEERSDCGFVCLREMLYAGLCSCCVVL